MKQRNLLLAGFLSLLLIGSAFAGDITRTELAGFERFLDSHPVIEKDLIENPALLKNSGYLAAHPELRTFLSSHPGIRDAKESPNALMNREREFDRTGKDIGRSEIKNFDEFLDKNPALEKELEKHPSLVNDPVYLAKHPALKQFLDNHPAIRQDLRENPRVFMHGEKKFEKAERKQAKIVRKIDRERIKGIKEQRREDRREQPRDLRVAVRHAGKR